MKVCGVRPRLAIVGGFIDPEAYEAATKLGVEVKSAVGDRSPAVTTCY